jgi:hypothetical protein
MGGKSVLRREGVWPEFLAYRQALLAETRLVGEMERLMQAGTASALASSEEALEEAKSATDAAFAALDYALLRQMASEI